MDLKLNFTLSQVCNSVTINNVANINYQTPKRITYLKVPDYDQLIDDEYELRMLISKRLRDCYNKQQE